MAGSAGQSVYEPINSIVPTYKTAVYGRLLEMILELELPPGSRLVEADLVARFGVSKTPIREAFLLLEADGLVTLAKFVGATVTPLAFREWEELVHLTDAVEQPNLERVAAVLTPADRDHVRDQVERLAAARRARDGRAYRDLLADIHGEMFARVGSVHLSRVIAWITRLARRYECAFVHRFDDTWDLELQVVQARIDGLLSSDPATANAAVTAGHAKLTNLIRGRLSEPEVARFLSPSE